jgi:photosystem II stability/assembly factor-like uncharacterized protein
MLRRSIRLALVLCALAPVAAARGAVLWTPLSSGTTQTITAIATPSATEVVFVTSGGQIRFLSGSTFSAATVTPANVTGFTDLAMSPDGTKGVAVGATGKIYKSSDSGHSWTQATIGPEHTGSCPNPGSGVSTLTDDLYSAKFADASTVYVTGANDDVLKSTNAGVNFTEVNKSTSSCVADPGGSTNAFTDTYWLDATNGYLLSNDFGQLFVTTTGFGSATARTGGANGFTFRDQLAVDPTDFTRAWAVSAGAANGSYFQLTTDGGSTWNTPTFDDSQVGLQDIAAVGGTVIAVGLGGDIYTSPDGRTFYRQIASPPNNTVGWRAVAMVSGSTAFVGGESGALVESTTANQIPDTTPPTGTISGPAHLAIGQFGTFTAHLSDNPGGSGIDPASLVWSSAGLPDHTGTPSASYAFSSAGSHQVNLAFKDLAGNPGSASFSVSVSTAVPPPPSGSSPSSTTTGGATVTIFKHVTVKGRKGRFIPVTLKCKKPRKFVITLVTIPKKHKRSKTLGKLTVTLKKGQKTIHLNISKKVGSGTYRLVVKVFTTGKHSHQTGRSVKQVFVLT